jgi:hypothetical protein
MLVQLHEHDHLHEDSTGSQHGTSGTSKADEPRPNRDPFPFVSSRCPLEESEGVFFRRGGGEEPSGITVALSQAGNDSTVLRRHPRPVVASAHLPHYPGGSGGLDTCRIKAYIHVIAS